MIIKFMFNKEDSSRFGIHEYFIKRGRLRLSFCSWDYFLNNLVWKISQAIASSQLHSNASILFDQQTYRTTDTA